MKAATLQEANRSFLNVIGAGLAAYESIPTAIGIFAAASGNPERCVIAGANVGFDTDTIASIAGALAGALRGFSAVPIKLYRRVIEVNNLNLENLARELVDIVDRRSAP
jgi:ADP-ribosylglycohydrolase